LGREVQNCRAQSRIGSGAVSIEESSLESIPSADNNTDSDSDSIDTSIDALGNTLHVNFRNRGTPIKAKLLSVKFENMLEVQRPLATIHH
jgi:hypothetical protein